MEISKEQILLGNSSKHTSSEKTVYSGLIEGFEKSQSTLSLKLQNFSRHIRRQDIARFLARYELFKLSAESNGSIVECGVLAGGGIASWLHFSSILEPYNHTRKIIGFDTFEGFPDVNKKDTEHGFSEHLYEGGYRVGSEIKEEIENLIQLHDQNRPLGHIPKVDLVKGDACKTIINYLETNPHLLISLLYLDFDLYEPTKVALEHLYPRVVKGGIVAFDELNCPEFPGETTALMETIPLDQVQLRRFPFDPYISYFVK